MMLAALLMTLSLTTNAQTPGIESPPAAATLPGPNAAAPVILRDTTKEYNLGRNWDVLAVSKDSLKDDGLTFSYLNTPFWARRFRPSTQEVPSYVGWAGEVWLRGMIVNQASSHTTWLLRAKLEPYEGFTAYVVTADGHVQQLAVNPSMPFVQTHAVTNGKYNIAVTLPVGQPVVLYVRTSGGVLNFSLCEQRNLQEISYWEAIGLAMFLGAMLMLALYNAFLFISIREVGYLYYAAYVLASCLLNLQIKGLLHQWFFPLQNAHAQHQQQLLLIGIVTLFGALMARSFLETKRLVPRLDRLLPIVMLSTPLPVLLNWALQDKAYVAIDLYYPLLTTPVWLVVGIAVLRTGYQPARYYMAGWGLLILSIMVLLLPTWFCLPLW